MATTRKSTPVPASAPTPEAEALASEGESKPESSKVRATDVLEPVFEAIQAAGSDGISLKALEDATGIRYRVLHNVTWHLQVKAEPPRIRRAEGAGRKLVFVAVEQEPAKPAKPARKPHGGKAPAKASAKAA